VEPPHEHPNKRRGANANYLEKAISRWGGKRKRTTQDDAFGNNVKRTRDENDATGVPTKQEMFEDRFAELAAFTTKHGHCNPSITPSSEYDSLREWCNGVRYVYNENMQQRKTTIMGTLSHDQIRRLEELGFEWNKNTLFEDCCFDEIVAFKTKHGQTPHFTISSTPVIKDSDRQFATAFSFAVLSEVESCEYGPRDITAKRVGLKVGFKGLACRHCRGDRRLGGRFFPSTIKTMSDTNKTLIPLFIHMLKCPAVSTSTKDWLENCKVNHDYERKNQKKYGSQKAFFTKIWERLHGKAPEQRTT
jgi:hypothetical protein